MPKVNGTYVENRKERLEKLRGQLMNERSSFESQWREAQQYILPRKARFFTQDANRGDKRYTSIIDSTATMAAFTLASGMMAGITSPARPWFRLTLTNPEMAELWSVKQWLDKVSQRMANVMLQSNLYKSLPSLYADLGTFLTGAMFVERDDLTTFTTQVFPPGSFYIAQDARGRVNVFMRRFQMTVRQIVDEFGYPDGKHRPIDWSNISQFVKDQWNLGQRETWVEVIHFVIPNEQYDANALESKYKKFYSCYYESQISGVQNAGGDMGGGIDQDRFLRESGYDYFPVLCPRWSVTGEDVYGTDGPGTIAIGDTKALQILHKRKGQAIEKKINPPMNAPAHMKNAKLSVLPGEVNYIDPRAENAGGFVPAYQIQFDITELKDDILAHQRRVQRAYHEDTFRLLIDDERQQRATAAEIHAKQQEKMLDLGPVLEQLNQDMLDPLIDIIWYIMSQSTLPNGEPMIPQPPNVIAGQDIKVEYVSIMALAQKANMLGSYDRFAMFVGQLAAVDPSVLDMVNRDKLVFHYAEMCGVATDVTVDEDKVAAIRAQRAKQQQMQQQAAVIQQGADAANKLAGADMEGDNALTRLINQSNAGALPVGAA